ncbi:MAG: 30S ribosomal protein S12 methylthiotransferase RimO [Acidobacteria bacterium]|nr:30S ribosomal protein S12 methylthiotransferase RimO [Acidobacteriota bacterium]MBU4306314.1 30S ribosomal protein S12 methylthiotransferase RimO [Acidobacteriota bacterium]MBU4404839.1 30S ribosomal protein S12 methylthiotransferase RimO [Acidobacteriota bacterium]MCG2812378.1 30S ribosomal protein S12 methylthiotransferase RimO [Candidatus Aminicenantes bacterium]
MKKKQEPERRSASFVSLGCFKNTVDSEVLAGMLKEHGMEIVSEYEDPDWLVINTCGFIRDAKEESIEEILTALEKKEKGEIKKLAVFGCLIQRYHKELQTTFDKADILWGVNDIEELAAAIAAGRPTEYPDQKLFLYSDKNQRPLFTTANSSFIKISEGCNMTCSFCSIPQIRGPFRSRTIPSILKEAEALKKKGVEELNLISQNSTYFGKDRGKCSQLPALLKEISGLGFRWLRVLYLMPEEVTPEILDGFARPLVLPYFDLPFQHVSARVLKRMNRGGSYEKNLRLLREIRKRFPDAVLRSTFIVGFPGESEDDFKQLLDFSGEAKLERIGAFAFSPEENTAGFKLPNRKNPQTIEDRKNILLDVSDRNMKKFNQGLVGRTLQFLPLAPWTHDSTIGRIWAQAPEVDGHCEVQAKFIEGSQMFSIKISGFQNEMLHGEKS